MSGSPTIEFGYCGNVHPGTTLKEVKQNLATHALAVKAQFCPKLEMPIGLWLSKSVVDELQEPVRLTAFRDWLAESGLIPFSLNGFPYDDFHQEVVKHDVYLPTWADRRRLDYTKQLATVFDQLLPPETDATISTLPLGWPNWSRSNIETDETFKKACAENIVLCAQHLHQIAEASGRVIQVCIEPEPGCVLDNKDDIVDFFQRHLFSGTNSQNELVRRHIGVCHDVCHSAVMFEQQAKAIAAYNAAGIVVGKVQVSSAVEVDFDSASDLEQRQQMLNELARFAEPRYLHQTSVAVGDKVSFYEDLQPAIESTGPSINGQWRVHFHVPVFLEKLGSLRTTQNQIKQCLHSILPGDSIPQFEIETYAWNVLPQEHQPKSLADGIAQELCWFEKIMSSSLGK